MGISSAKVDIWNRALDRVGETQGVESEDEDSPAAGVCRNHYDDIIRELLETRDWPWALRQMPLTQISDQVVTHAGDDSRTVFDIPYAFRDPATLEVIEIQTDASEVTLVAVTDYTLTLAQEGSNAYITTATAPATGESIQMTVTVARVGWEYVYALPADFVKAIGLLYTDTRFTKVSHDARLEFQIMPNENSDAMILCCDVDNADFDGLEYVAMIDYIPLLPRHFVDAVAWRLACELAYAIRKDPKMGEHCRQRAARALDESSAYSQNDAHDSAREPITPSEAARG
jgi:hypothetical protein